jgi:hypothetical protein
MMRTLKIVIPREGPPRALYSEAAQALLAPVGDMQIRRVSYVEPTDSLSDAATAWLSKHHTGPLPPNAWWADLTLVRGPVLGPFNTRDYALQEEIDWLHEHAIPFVERDQERLQREAERTARTGPCVTLLAPASSTPQAL